LLYHSYPSYVKNASSLVQKDTSAFLVVIFASFYLIPSKSVIIDLKMSKPEMTLPPALKSNRTDRLKKQAAEIVAVDVNFSIVGIGASAGGLAAFEAFFSGMPSDRNPNMAFVLVQHLSPDHSSALADIIQRYTRMKVVEVQDGMSVESNCVYIIPPGYDMAFLHGELHLIEPAALRGQRLTIDLFFRSLAQDLHARAIGIILSGTGSDGAEGIKAIKAAGGLVIVQTPDSAEYDGMPLRLGSRLCHLAPNACGRFCALVSDVDVA
jgi:two-component system CheB/CheR fusion protein